MDVSETEVVFFRHCDCLISLKLCVCVQRGVSLVDDSSDVCVRACVCVCVCLCWGWGELIAG